MKISELIEELQKLDGDLELHTHDPVEDFSFKVDSVTLEPCFFGSNGGYYEEETTPDDTYANSIKKQKVIRLSLY